MFSRFLILGLILLSPTSRGEETVTYNDGNQEQVVPIAIANDVSIVPRKFNLQVREAGRSWSEAEVQDLNASFELWMRCNLNPDSDPECSPCLPGDPFTFQIEDVLATRCLPAPRDRVIAFNDNLTEEQKRRRDRQICECFQRGQGNVLENFTFEQAKRDVTQQMVLARLERAAEERDRDQNTIDRLLNERVQTALNAANYLNDAQNASQLAARYNVKPERRRSILNRWSRHLNELASQADSIQIGNEIFNASNQNPRYCVPYRHYLASKQFPEDSFFYTDIAANEEFTASDWNYNEIMERLRSQSNGRQIKDVINENEYAHRLYARAKFLFDNPAIKNIFLSSGSDALKRELFNNIRTIPSPDYTTVPPTRGQAWIARANDYRTVMASFLNRNEVILASHDGAIAARETNYNAVQSREDSERVTSDMLAGDANTVATTWSGLCSSREANRTDYRIRRKSIDGFVDDVQSTFGVRDFDHPDEDDDYVALNHEVCDMPRRDASGRSKTFNQFLTDRCGSSREGNCHPINRPLMMRDFTDAYPIAEDNGKRALSASVVPFIDGSISIPVFGNREVQAFHYASSDPVLSRSSVRFSSTPQVASMELLRPQLATVRNANIAIRPVSETMQPLNVLNPNLPIQNMMPINPVVIPQPNAEQKPQTAETTRITNNRNESTSSGLSEQLADLRNSLLQERVKNERGQPNEFASLNARLASLERSIEQKRIENRELEARLARVTDDSRGAPSVSEAPAEPRRRTPAAATTQLSAPAIQGPVSSGSISAPAFSGGATLGGSNSGRSVSAPSSQRASASSTGLERFGVRSSSQQGAITVAAPSSAIDYNALRSQSGDNVESLSVTPEEFNQIANNDQSVFSRYLEQLKSMPGEVVRINVSVPDDGRSLELFVVKNGDQISLVPGQSAGRTIASDGTVVPEKPVERSATLDGLRGELRN